MLEAIFLVDIKVVLDRKIDFPLRKLKEKNKATGNVLNRKINWMSYLQKGRWPKTKRILKRLTHNFKSCLNPRRTYGERENVVGM